MKINSAIEIENALFNRKEVEAKVESNITPKNEEALKLVADKYSVPQDNVKIKGIYGSFGSQEFRVLAHVYKTKEDLEKTEVKTKQEKEAEKKAIEDEAKAKAAEVEAKKKAEEEKKAAKEAAKAEAEKPKEEVKAEEPAKEEVKEEKKEEDKK
jgi:ribosomal protein S24E